MSPLEQDLIVLDSFEKLTYNAKRLLTQDFTQRPNFEQCRDNLIKSLGLGVYNSISENFYNEAYRSSILNDLLQKGIACVAYGSDHYPDNLYAMEDSPMVLYAKGNLELLKGELFAVVGSRKVNPYAQENCRKIVQELGQRFVVCSGLSDGSEEVATRSALEAGNIVCLLAHGHDLCYPASAQNLKDEVEQHGLTLSEFPPATKALKFRFPRRNRVLACLCVGTLVIAAGQKSGALITAEYAEEFGREVFAFPYNIDVTSGTGCNDLIKKGAHLTENILDIADCFGLHLNKQQTGGLNAQEKKVMDVLRPVGEMHVNELAQALGCEVQDLFVTLSMLEVKKRIVRMAGNRFAIV